MITKEQYETLRARLVVYDEWAKQFTMKNGWRVVPNDAVPPVTVTNEDRSAIELYEFVHNAPDKYFLYINADKHTANTWTGEKLGRVEFGNAWRDNFGGVRVHVRVYAVNGYVYSGTYFKTAGDYARVRKLKEVCIEGRY